MISGWHDISEIEKFKEYYEFNSYAVYIEEEDEDGEIESYSDLSFGIVLMPKGVKRFFCIPDDEQQQ